MPEPPAEVEDSPVAHKRDFTIGRCGLTPALLPAIK